MALPYLLQRLALRLALLHAAVDAACPGAGQWVDVDTPLIACDATSEHDGGALELVFSDEFELAGRLFLDGHDARWTALELAPTTNEQVNYYNASLAFTEAGSLVLRSTHDDVTLPLDSNSSWQEGDPPAEETRHLQTAMVQTWQKFCFSEGAAEVRARLPGRASQAGLWPAFWLMGNLGRATFPESTDGIWPWLFDECVAASDPDCTANQCTSQRISACDAAPGHGLNAFQGRGAPEIDVVEVQPGTHVNDYGAASYFATLGCATPDQATRNAVRMSAGRSTPMPREGRPCLRAPERGERAHALTKHTSDGHIALCERPAAR